MPMYIEGKQYILGTGAKTFSTSFRFFIIAVVLFSISSIFAPVTLIFLPVLSILSLCPFRVCNRSRARYIFRIHRCRIQDSWSRCHVIFPVPSNPHFFCPSEFPLLCSFTFSCSCHFIFFVPSSSSVLLNSLFSVPSPLPVTSNGCEKSYCFAIAL